MWKVAQFIDSGVVVIPMLDGRVSYMDEQVLDQFYRDHMYDMYDWYREQFQQDSSELQVMNNLIAPLGFESPQVVMPNTLEEEKDPEEDSEEVEDTEESKDFNDSRDSMGSDEPENHRDPEDFELQDYQGRFCVIFCLCSQL